MKSTKKYKTRKKISVNHYWAKSTEIKFSSDSQRLLFELLMTAIFIPIVIHCYQHKSLQIFFVGLIIPACIFSISAAYSIFLVVSDLIERFKKNGGG